MVADKCRVGFGIVFLQLQGRGGEIEFHILLIGEHGYFLVESKGSVRFVEAVVPERDEVGIAFEMEVGNLSRGGAEGGIVYLLKGSLGVFRRE